MEAAKSAAGVLEFEAVRKTKVYEEVVGQIERLITGGRLKTGDKLPPERELAEMFSVSRSSVRDAIRTLEMIGLVEPHHGEGTVVCDLSPESLISPITNMLVRKRALVGELLEVRKMIEPPLAARAAARASAREVAYLEDILRRQKEKLGRGEVAIEEDSEFHYAVATAARNSVVMKVLDVLMDLLRESRARSLQVEGRRQKSFAGHRRILSAIKRHAAAAAEAAMRRHLEEIEDVILEKL